MTPSNSPHMTLRCLAVDDEKFALDLLADNIRRVPFLELVGTCRNALEAAEFLQRETIDLMFIDVQMPGLSGLQFVRSLRPSPQVIFVTAYETHALDAFGVDALDYLVKPVRFERFLQAANKAMRFHGRLVAEPPAAPARPNGAIFLNVEYQLVKVVLSDILYIEGLKDYVKIHLRQPKRFITTKITLKAIEEMLPKSLFTRLHRSYIVAHDAVEVVTRDSVILGDKLAEIPVGEMYKSNLPAITGRVA